MLIRSALLMSLGILAGNAYGAEDQSNQFCLSNGDETYSCFLETIHDGRSTLYTEDESYSQLVFNEILVEANAEFIVLSESEYADKLTALQPNSFVYGNSRMDAFDFNAAQSCAQADGKSGGWWQSWGKCAAGTLGGAVTGGVTGFLGGSAVGTVLFPGVGTVSGGSVGGIGGAIGGGLSGAAAACGYRFYVHYQGKTYDVTESRRHNLVLRCT